MKRLERPIYHRLTALLWTFIGTQAILILLLPGATRDENKTKNKSRLQGKTKLKVSNFLLIVIVNVEHLFHIEL